MKLELEVAKVPNSRTWRWVVYRGRTVYHASTEASKTRAVTQCVAAARSTLRTILEGKK